jgi:PmbA protein
VFWSASESSYVGVRDRQRAEVHAPIALGRGFALDYLFQWVDGRISSGAAEKIAIEEPDRFLRLAREAAFDDPDGANFAGPASMPDFPLFSEASAENARSGGEATFGALLEAAESLASKWGFETWSGSVSASASARGVLTSRGLSAHAESTHEGYAFWYEGRTGDGHASREPIPPAEARGRLERACELVSRLGRPQAGFDPGSMPVMIHPKVVDSLVSTYILGNLHGDRIHHGQSAFRMEQFGSPEHAFSPLLGLRLEPSVPMDVGSYRFTSEGVPARPVAYIENGRLLNPILDLKYARRLRREPVPGPAGSDSLRLTGPQAISEQEAYSRIGRGVLVLSLLGLHTQDTTRGDFSISAPQTLTVEGGALGSGVKAVLTGNFFEVLRDPELGFVTFEGFRTPGLLYSGSVGVDASG